jgi:hypothetical protein
MEPNSDTELGWIIRILGSAENVRAPCQLQILIRVGRCNPVEYTNLEISVLRSSPYPFGLSVDSPVVELMFHIAI